MHWFRTVYTLLSGCLALAVLAYQPSPTSPYTFIGCDVCGSYSHERVGDGNFHQPGCGQSGPPLYWCDCSIGYAGSEMLQPPVLTVDGTDVVLEYWARNIYCNPPPDGGNPQEPNAVSYRIEIVELDPVTLATISVRHRIAPYWEHGKVTLTNLSPACKLYRAIYLVDTIFGTTYAVSSDVVGATGSATAGGASCLLDMGSCPVAGGGGASPFAGVSPSVGAPINVGSGNMYYSEPLFSIDGPGASALSFGLAYNSRETTAGTLGPGFTHTFDQRLTAVGNHRLWRGPDGLRVLWVLENHPPTGQIRRAVYPGDRTGTMTTVGSNFQIKALDGGVTEFNTSSGRWVRSADRWGNAVTATGGSDPTTITDALGRSLTLAYISGKLSSITDGDGNLWRFEYDGGGRLEKVFDPLHTSTTPWRQYSWLQYTTGSPYVLAKVTDDSGAVLEAHQYDAQGRAISSWSGDTVGSPPAPGPSARDLVTIAYDTASQTTVTSTVDTGLTQASVYTLETGAGRFLATSIVGTCVSCGQVEDAVQFTFDAANHPLTRIVGTGGEQVETRYVYDENGMVTSMTEAFGKPEQRTVTYGYAETDWPAFATSITESSAAKPGQSKVSTLSWNANETQLTRSISGFLASTDSAPTVYTTTTTFDAKHRMTQQDGPRSGQRTAWTYYADADANLNRRGRLQTFTLSTTTTTTLATTYDDYDVYGTPGVETDPNGVIIERTLDERGRTRLERSVKPPADPNEPADYVTATDYDSRDRLTAITRPLGNKTKYEYEAGTGRLLQTIRVDAGGNERERIVYTLNTVGGKTSESYEECTTPALTCTTWVSRRSDAFAYNATGRLSTITHPDATTVVYDYDSRGNLVSVKDERHSAANTFHGYDSLNRLTTVTQKRTIVPGSDVVTAYAYDVQSNLTSVTDPNGNITTYSFDDFGRTQKQVSPVTGTTTYTYDAAGNLTSSTDANGTITDRAYDLASRILTARSSRSGASAEAVAWSYDDTAATNYGKGRLFQLRDPSGLTTYAYERRGLPRTERRGMQDHDYATAYGYDANANRNSITYPSGRIVTFTFDEADRPLSAANIVSSVAYRPFGPEEQIVFSNGTTRTADYDLRYRPLENKLAAVTDIASYDYIPDAAGNVTAINDAINPAYNRTFAYDDLNRLITANSGASLWGGGDYSYDAMGNMLTGTLGGTTTTFSYLGTTPKLASVSGAPVSYDGVGNETAVGGSLFVYSPRNFLTGGEGLAYQYDGRGVRTTAMQIPAGSPAVLDIAPPSGPAAGGTSLTITGANFSAATTVTIAGIAATITNRTPTTLTVTTPPASAGTLATIVITNPGSLSTSIVNGHIYDFNDVPPGNPTYPFVINIARNRITSGCAPGNYCPNDPVLRSQMAFFLLRAKHGGAYVPPLATGTMFDDVPINSFGAAWIEQLAREGITGGCQASPPLYCPNASVTRAQMAIFLLRTKYGPAYQPPPATGTLFGDVPAGGVPFNFIEQLAREGVTGGCQANPPLYCPNASVTRAQMAIFLVRAVNLQDGIQSTLARRHFLYSPDLHLLAETEITTNPSPAVLYEYVWMNNHPVAQVEPVANTTYFTFTDPLGTPLLLTRTDTSTFWRAEHEPYGKVFALRGNDEHQPLRLPGQEAEQFNLGPNGATERSYNIFRWYRPGWGRYTQSDPDWSGTRIREINQYAYVSDNPTRFTDRLGLRVDLRCRPVGWGGGFSMGDVAGLLGAKHCYLSVSCDGGNGIPPTTISYLGNRTGVEIGSDYLSPRMATNWNRDVQNARSGQYDQYEVKEETPCCGDFERCLLSLARELDQSQYSLGEDYDAAFGPNSNSVVRRLIRQCGGDPNNPRPRGATGWW